jgi:hypothetical protein
MDPDDYDEPDVRAAIAETLRDQQSPRNRHQSSGRSSGDVIDLTGDSVGDKLHSQATEPVDLINDQEEDEDLRKAIALSMQEQNSPDPQPQHTAEQVVIDKETVKISEKNQQAIRNLAPSAFSILGIDRKKLEEERLARVAKRKVEQSISPPPTSRERKVAKQETFSSTGYSRSTISSVSLGSSSSDNSSFGPSTTKESSIITVTPSSHPSIQVPKGAVKKTWVFHCPRRGDDIKIEEVFQRSDLELAILSAFQWDMEWLFTKLDTKKSRFLLVMQAKEESTVS